MTTSSNRSRDDAGENKAVLDLAKEAVAGIKGIRERLDDADARINQLEADKDAGRGGGGSSGNEQKQWTILRRFLAEGGKSQSAPNDWMAASGAAYQDFERKSIEIGTPGLGGHAVPEVMERQITRRMAEVNAIRALSRVVQVTTAPSSYKVPISLGGTASGWVGENDSRTATASPAFSAPSFPDGELYAYPNSSAWALDDIPNLQRFLQDEVADVFAAAEATAFLTGNATKKPKGILDETPVTTADDASPMRDPFALKYTPLDPGSSPSDGLQADEIITLAHDLPAGYWPNATWLMSRPTLAAVRKLKDSYGQYLWTPSLSPGNPSQLLGLPVAISDAMASPGQNALCVLLADFSRLYCILERPTRLVVDQVTAPGFVKFYFHRRISGHVVDNHAGRVGKCAAA